MNYLIKDENTHFRVQTKLNGKTTISQVFINKKACGKRIYSNLLILNAKKNG